MKARSLTQVEPQAAVTAFDDAFDRIARNMVAWTMHSSVRAAAVIYSRVFRYDSRS